MSSTTSNRSRDVSTTDDLSDRYHKLAAESSKSKAQLLVLKKAILNEQATKAQLRDQLKQKDKQLRESLESLDTLKFHNETLSRRVQGLQDESTNKPKAVLFGGKTAKKESGMLREAIEATTLELERKIRENESIHQELYEVNSMYTKNITALQEKVSELEQKKEALELEVARSNLAGEESLASLKHQNKSLENHIAEMQRDITNAKNDMLAMEQIKSEWEAEKRTTTKNLLDALRVGLASIEKISSASLEATTNTLPSETLSRIENFHKSLTQPFPTDASLSSHAERTVARIRHGLEIWLQILNHAVSRLSTMQTQHEAISSQKMELKGLLQAEVEKTNRQITQLQSKDEKIKLLQDACRNEKLEKEEMVQKYQKELQAAQKDMNDLRDTVNKILEDVESTERRRENEKESLTGELASVRAKYREMVGELQSAKARNNDLQNQLDSLQNTKGVELNALEDLSQRNEELSEQLEKLRQELAKASSRISAEQEDDQSQVQVNGHFKQTNDEDDEVFEYRSSDGVDKDADTIDTKSAEIQTDLVNVEEEPSQKAKENEKIEALEKKVSEARAYVRQQKMDLNVANERVQATEQTNKLLATELDRAQGEANKANNELVLTRKQITNLEEQLARALDDLHTTEAGYKQQIDYMTEQLLHNVESTKENLEGDE